MKLNRPVIKLALLGVLLSLAACGGPSTSPRVDSSSTVDRRCAYSPQSCLYNGRYELGERAYAEQAAADLNRQQSLRLRRGGWFR
ncbi:MAG: hypothetical protein Q4G44_07175 [Alcaligenaceae bacterium]|nr:hypothetical protein [Alcaligenaceae bacterium]